MLTESQKAVCRNTGISEAEFTAAHARRTANSRHGAEDAPFADKPATSFADAIRRVQALQSDDDDDTDDCDDVEETIRRARNHLAARDADGDSLDPDERLARAARCLMAALEARMNPDSPNANRRGAVRFE